MGPFIQQLPHIHYCCQALHINLFNPYQLPCDIDITLYQPHKVRKQKLRKAIFI